MILRALAVLSLAFAYPVLVMVLLGAGIVVASAVVNFRRSEG